MRKFYNDFPCKYEKILQRYSLNTLECYEVQNEYIFLLL